MLRHTFRSRNTGSLQGKDYCDISIPPVAEARLCPTDNRPLLIGVPATGAVTTFREKRPSSEFEFSRASHQGGRSGQMNRETNGLCMPLESTALQSFAITLMLALTLYDYTDSFSNKVPNDLDKNQVIEPRVAYTFCVSVKSLTTRDLSIFWPNYQQLRVWTEPIH